MSTLVADLELSASLPLTALPPGATGALALVRLSGRPIGLARLSGLTGTITPEQWRRAIDAQIVLATPPPIPRAEPISIVVCTHERPDDLRRCLDALRPLVAAGHEALVVDNAPRTSRTAAVAGDYPVRYLVEPRQGLDYARNLGLRAAQHAIVAYTDDDAAPDRAWADAIAAPFTDAAVGCVTGLVLPLELETPAQELFERYCAHRRTFERVTLSAPAVAPATAGIAGMGANMALRRDLALRLGGFDPRLDGGTPTCSGGDTDMFARVLAAGQQIVYTPDALVWHRHRREDEALRSCLFGYGVGLSSFLTKRLIEAGDWDAPVIAARWTIGPFVKALRHRLRGEPTVPLRLLLHEAAGMLLGPLRLRRAGAQHRTRAMEAEAYGYESA
jgi:GT2 family glycosyltransferase